MKKNIILILTLFLLAQTSFAIEIGYVDIAKVVSNYSLAQKYKKEEDNKYKEINNVIKQQEKEISKIKDETVKNLKRKEAVIKIEQKQQEYIILRKKREDEISNKIKAVADKIRAEKKLDIIVRKESAISGGIDVTQAVINGLK